MGVPLAVVGSNVPAGRDGGLVLAHVGVVKADPPANAVVNQPAGPVRVTFDGPVTQASGLQVIDAGFHRVDQGPTRVENARTLTVGVEPKAMGWLTVQYTAVGSDDGHTTTGSYAVEVVSAPGLGGAIPPAIGAVATVALIVAAVGVLWRRQRAAATVLAAAALLPILAGCRGTATPAATQANAAAQQGTPSSVAAPATSSADSVVLAASDLAVGPDRFAFALLDKDGALIENAKVTVTFFHLEGETAAPVATQDATYFRGAVAGTGLYVVRQKFDVGGLWGAEMRPKLASGEELPPQRVRFQVAAAPRSPAVGARPPPTTNPTVRQVVPGGFDVHSSTPAQLAAISSDPDPDPDFYAMTVDEAAASGRPTVVVFATPGHCQTQLCGPVLDEVKKLKREWSGRVNFIHIDVYGSFDPLVLSPLMDTWGLNTEPWVFVMAADGKIADRLEGNVTAAELGPIVASIAGAPS